MAIYLIDKIKPKNNGSFPMVDAEDVLMPDGTRLDQFKGGVTSVNGQTGDVNIEIPEAINGKDGEDGKDGSNGKDGADGVSPTVAITTITGGHRVTVTDATGTQFFDVMDGQDGEDGEDGQDGNSASITVDSELSETSENPVQNKVIVAELSALVEEFRYALNQLSETIPTDEHINALIDAKLANFLNVSEVGM